MALDRPEHWRYFGDDADAAVEALRERLEPVAGAADLGDEDLLRRLRRAVGLLEHVTGWFFRPRDGALEIDGNGAERLTLPHPVVSQDQLAEALDVEVQVEGDDDVVDATRYRCNAGALPGPDDPRLDPAIAVKRVSSSGAYIASESRTRWPEGDGNISVTATWGYLEEDGTTPEPILDCLARLVALSIDQGVETTGAAPGASAITAEAVDGRSYSYSAAAASYGLTLDRTIDSILRAFTRPPDIQVSRGRGDLARAARSSRW